MRRAAQCGTDGGYYRHRRTTKTQPCEPCLAAHAEAVRQRPLAGPMPECACGRQMNHGSVQCWVCNREAKQAAGRDPAYTYSDDDHDPKRPVAWIPKGGVLRPVFAGGRR